MRVSLLCLVLAVALTMGTMNVYIAGASKLIASLGLEGALPKVLAGDSHRTVPRRPLVLIVGAEGEGMHQLLRKKCDALLRLPMLGRVGSLNAAVAGSVLLYEVVRQRGAATK